MAWTNPTTVSTGTVLTASRYNADVVANWNAFGDAWTSYTPTVAGGTITLGSGGANNARYLKIGRVVIAVGSVVWGSGGSVSGGPITLSLPAAAASGSITQVGASVAFDSSASAYGLGMCEVASGASVLSFRWTISGGTIKGFGGGDPWTWAASDAISWSITYEAAS